MKKTIIITMLLLTFMSGIGYAQNNDYDSPTLINRVVTMPAGKTFKAIFLTPVSSESAMEGQEVNLATGTDFYYKGKLIAPAGSKVSGKVIGVSSAKHGSLSGKLALRFTAIVTPAGQNIPISAIPKTEDNSGVIIGGTTLNKDNDNVVETSVLPVETAQTHTSKINFGKGAAIINEVGLSGGGLLKSIWDKGQDVDIPVSTPIELILTQPITVTPSEDGNQ